MGNSKSNAERLGDKLAGDLRGAYNRQGGPYDQSLWTDLSGETKGLIDAGLGQNQQMQGGLLSQVAGGEWLNGQNPYFENALSQAKGNAMTDVNSLFNSNGRFGSGAHVGKATSTLADIENNARLGQFETEYNRMTGAQDALARSNTNALNYSGLLDMNTQAQRLGEAELYDRTNNAEMDKINRYLGILSTNQDAPGLAPETPWWQSVLGAGLAVGNTAAKFVKPL